MKVTVEVARTHDARATSTYEVEADRQWAILDVLLHIVREIDPTLSVRYACRVGMCGSCAIIVNGKERLACRTLVADEADRLDLRPLRNLPAVKDLVSDFEAFYDRYARVGPASGGSVAADKPGAAPFTQLGDCITCGICVSACTMVTVNPRYVGPAALYRIGRMAADPREAGASSRTADVADEDGLYGCRGHLDCVASCPKGLPIAQTIHWMKRRAALGVEQGARRG